MASGFATFCRPPQRVDKNAPEIAQQWKKKSKFAAVSGVFRP
jgi:hypothetical protein